MKILYINLLIFTLTLFSVEGQVVTFNEIKYLISSGECCTRIDQLIKATQSSPECSIVDKTDCQNRVAIQECVTSIGEQIVGAFSCYCVDTQNRNKTSNVVGNESNHITNINDMSNGRGSFCNNNNNSDNQYNNNSNYNNNNNNNKRKVKNIDQSFQFSYLLTCGVDLMAQGLRYAAKNIQLCQMNPCLHESSEVLDVIQKSRECRNILYDFSKNACPRDDDLKYCFEDIKDSASRTSRCYACLRQRNLSTKQHLEPNKDLRSNVQGNGQVQSRKMLKLLLPNLGLTELLNERIGLYAANLTKCDSIQKTLNTNQDLKQITSQYVC